MIHVCPDVNTEVSLQAGFWSLKNGPLDAHKIGWIMSGAGASVTTIICLIASYQHARHYHKPKVQRQIIRILWMPMVFSIISFFSYRFFRTYTYYELIIIVYEALVLMAFLALMLAYVGDSSDEQMAVFRSKDKRGLPWPFRSVRFRPSKPYFLHALNISVLQYALLRPLISITGMICERFNVLCAHIMAPYFAEVYLDAVDFVSISIALYGLAVLYVLVVDLLKDKRPVAKFLSIKLLVFFTYYQQFLFSALANRGIIAETEFWTKTNVADGLNAMTICLEMVLFSLLMWWAYPAKEYKCMSRDLKRKTNPLWAFWQALNYWDFLQDAWRGFLFLVGYVTHKHGTRSSHHAGHKGTNEGQQFDIDAAFNRSRPDDGPAHEEMESVAPHSQAIDAEKPPRPSSDSSWTMVKPPQSKQSLQPAEPSTLKALQIPSVIVTRPTNAAPMIRSRSASPAPTIRLPDIPAPSPSSNVSDKRPLPRHSVSTPVVLSKSSHFPSSTLDEMRRSVARPGERARASTIQTSEPTGNKQTLSQNNSMPDELETIRPLNTRGNGSPAASASSAPFISPLSLLKKDDWLSQAGSSASPGSSLQSKVYETAEESGDSQPGSWVTEASLPIQGEPRTSEIKEKLVTPGRKRKSRSPSRKSAP